MNKKLRHKDAIDIPHPECDKALAVKADCQIIGQFLEWVYNSKGYEFGVWAEEGDYSEGLSPTNSKIDDLLAEYFEIDQKKIEEEKLALLAEIRRRNNSQN